MRKQNKPFLEIKCYVDKLKTKFPNELKHIVSDRILYTSFSRNKSRALARIGSIPKKLSRFLMEYTYFMEVHEESWKEANEAKRLYIILHELYHIPEGGFVNSNPEYKKLIRHDIQDFGILLTKFGVNMQNIDTLAS